MTDLSDRQRKRATYHVKQIEHVATVLERGPSVSGSRMPWFQVLSECVRRGSITVGADGFAVGGGAAGPKNGVSDSTGNMAMARIESNVVDPVGDACRRVWARINEIERLTNELTGDVAFVLTVDDGVRGRVTSVDECPICGTTITGVGEDRVRRGFCPRCYQAGARERRSAMEKGDHFDWTLWAMRRQDKIGKEAAS